MLKTRFSIHSFILKIHSFSSKCSKYTVSAALILVSAKRFSFFLHVQKVQIVFLFMFKIHSFNTSVGNRSSRYTVSIQASEINVQDTQFQQKRRKSMFKIHRFKQSIGNRCSKYTVSRNTISHVNSIFWTQTVYPTHFELKLFIPGLHLEPWTLRTLNLEPCTLNLEPCELFLPSLTWVLRAYMSSPTSAPASDSCPSSPALQDLPVGVLCMLGPISECDLGEFLEHASPDTSGASLASMHVLAEVMLPGPLRVAKNLSIAEHRRRESQAKVARCNVGGVPGPLSAKRTKRSLHTPT